MSKEHEGMILIPEGEFLMGSPEVGDSETIWQRMQRTMREEGNINERPCHKVYLDAFYMDKFEVTNEQYAAFLNVWGKNTDENGHKMIQDSEHGVQKGFFKKIWKPAFGKQKHPVVRVSWYGATQYCKWANKRLPTEAEWEKAARAGTNTLWSFGDDYSMLGEYAWYDGNSGYESHPVGQKKPNPYGLYDMHGNASEWVADRYGEDYYSKSPERNPKGPETGTRRVSRGGSWNDSIAGYTRSGMRFMNNPDDMLNVIGFRCVAA